MKKLILSLTSALLIVGCTITQQTLAYKSLYSVESSTTKAFDTYAGLVIRGNIQTNDLPRVAGLYNKFQAGFLIALDGARYNTNALAPENLIVEGQDIVTLINVIQKNK